MKKPKQTTLLIVSGMSPAIITETIWALAQEGNPCSFVRIITTKTGAKRLESLFKPQETLGGLSPWEALKTHLGKNAPRLENTGNHIRVIPAEKEGELEDITTEADNRCLANFLMEEVRSITSNPDNRLIASVAGGRKTMGTLLYATTSLLGREEDLITHVLVNPPYETSPWFWFPDQPGKHPLNPKDAKIQLGKIPFVPLQRTVEDLLGENMGSFETLVTLCSQSIPKKIPNVDLNLSDKSVTINGKTETLPARTFSLIRLIAEDKNPEKRNYDQIFTEWKEKCQKWEYKIDNIYDIKNISHDLHEIRKVFQKMGPEGHKIAKLLPNRSFPGKIPQSNFKIKK